MTNGYVHIVLAFAFPLLVTLIIVVGAIVVRVRRCGVTVASPGSTAQAEDEWIAPREFQLGPFLRSTVPISWPALPGICIVEVLVLGLRYWWLAIVLGATTYVWVLLSPLVVVPMITRGCRATRIGSQ